MRRVEIRHDLERELADGAGAFDRQASAALGDHRLKAFEFATPYRFHIPIAVHVAYLGRISDTHGSDLKKIRLGSTGELYAVSRIGSLPKNHSTAIDPCRRHSLRNLVTEAGKTFEHGT